MKISLVRACLVMVVTGAVIAVQGCGQKAAAPDLGDNEQHEEAASTGKERMPEHVTSQVEMEAKKTVGAKINLKGVFRTFPVYTDGKSPDNHFAPTGWMGDYSDIKIDEKCMVEPHSGSTCIEIVYNNKATQGARWAGIYWQNPPNNWGTRAGGYNLSGAKKLTFWARGKKGGERIEEFKLGGITGEYSDTDVSGIGPAVLTDKWQQFSIDADGKDLSSISGGFAWAANLDSNPDGLTFYLDDIKYE